MNIFLCKHSAIALISVSVASFNSPSVLGWFLYIVSFRKLHKNKSGGDKSEFLAGHLFIQMSLSLEKWLQNDHNLFWYMGCCSIVPHKNSVWEIIFLFLCCMHCFMLETKLCNSTIRACAGFSSMCSNKWVQSSFERAHDLLDLGTP